MVEKSATENSSTMDDNENYLELSKMNFSPFHFHQANVNVNQFAKFAQNLPTPQQVLSIVSGSDGNVQFLQAQPQMTTPATAINPTQTYITLPITIPPNKPGDATQTFQIQVLNPNPVPQPKFQIPLLQQHGTTVLTVAYSPQDGEILPNQMTEGGPVTVLAAIQPQDLQLLAQQNGLTAQQQALQHTLQQHHQQQQQQQQQSQGSDSDENNAHEKETRHTIKTEPSFWGQAPVTISAVPSANALTTDLNEFFHTRTLNHMQPFLKFNTEGINIKKELNYSDAVTQIHLTDNNNVLSINNFNSTDNSNNNNNSSNNAANSSIDTNDEDQNPDVESTSQAGDEEKVELDANGKVKKKRKVKKKTPKLKKPKPGQVHIATAIDGTILFCCPECSMAYPEKESLEQHLAVHKIERRYICDICGAGLKRKEHLERHKLGHNPERPYVCQVCLKGFKRKEHLNLHVVIHSGLKTEICAECGKGFYRKDHLRKHIKSHQTKRAKEEANSANVLQNSNNNNNNTIESTSETGPIIKREVLSPNNSPPQTEETNPSPVTISPFSLPREVTIHVTSNNTTLPVQIQLPQLITTTSSNGEVIVKLPDS